MAITCPPGFSLDPENALPSKPKDSLDLKKNNAYSKVKYEWEKADNSAPTSCGCGQQCNFNMTYGTSADGSITLTPYGVGGSVGVSSVQTTELSVDVGSKEFEYVGTKVLLKETTETGTYSSSRTGFLASVRLAWRIMWYGLSGAIPQITFDLDDTEVKYIQAAWLVCRKPCRRNS